MSLKNNVFTVLKVNLFSMVINVYNVDKIKSITQYLLLVNNVTMEESTIS
jgi:hypothetical protein